MRRVTSLVLVLLVVLAGCAGAGGGDIADRSQQSGEEANLDYSGDGGGAAASTPAATGTPRAENADRSGDAGGAGQAVQRRELIRTARVTLEVDDFDAANERLTEYARSTGGFVGDSSRRVNGEGNDTWTVGQVTLRIPAGNYSEALAFINDTGTVRASEQSTRDVTEQVVDLEVRLENLRSERDQLRALYERANTTEDVLAVQQELSRVQTEIERTEARLQQLERQVAFTTVTVEIREPRPDAPDDDPQWYDTGVVAAFGESIDGVVVFLRASVVFGAYALPYLIVIGVPLGGGLLAVRRYRGRTTAAEPQETPPDSEPDDDTE
jgi:tetrahydromethanopterin S-methyltransferase subunit G